MACDTYGPHVGGPKREFIFRVAATALGDYPGYVYISRTRSRHGRWSRTATRTFNLNIWMEWAAAAGSIAVEFAEVRVVLIELRPERFIFTIFTKEIHIIGAPPLSLSPPALAHPHARNFDSLSQYLARIGPASAPDSRVRVRVPVGFLIEFSVS